MKRFLNPLMAASVVVLASACAKVERIEVKPAKVALSEAGQSVALSAQAVTAEGKPVEKAELAFASTNTKVATVDAAGKVTAVKSGSANISVTSGEVSASAPVEVVIPSAIVIQGAPFTLTGLGSEAVVEAEVKDDAGRPVKDSKLEYAAADANVVQVEGNKLVAKAVGTAKVTVTSGKLTQEFEVTVKLPEVDAVAFETVPATLKVGESAALAVVAKGTDGAAIKGVSFTFTTSDEKIATVDASGNVTAVKAGAVTIKAEGGSKAAETKLTIKKK
ncbi:Ig-like protein group 2 [Archangium gephyra]|uniref:Ig-like protein group 2 n=1 Tax=Archangium gephyra TaxID=48 RepID=A0AAC8QDF5_9BACT|nr:Ig-like domain-containing protein [Archangium gephyra]AKJ05359.1 von Willebrand factor type D domain protein [Archangium gephyra]REG36046.1 Ig-like protein group 2 [Archangium gephyra]